MTEIKVVKKNHLQSVASTPGIMREVAFKSKNVLFVRAMTSAGDVASGWHHHGEHDVYGYVVSGRIRFEYGTEGKNTVEAGPGDFFNVPAYTVHRDMNPNRDEGQVAIIAFVGSGPLVVNVEGPRLKNSVGSPG